MTTLLLNISKVQSNLNREISELRTGMKRCVAQIDNNCKKIKLLNERTSGLSRYYVKEEEKIPYVFTAPPRNRYFAGRTEEIQELKRILRVEETLNEKKVGVAAVCGLGGIGKTSLVSEYAHQMKDFYKGGVYWFSAEDDTHLSKTVNAVAVKIGAVVGSFDLTWPNILKKFSTVHDPCLIVLDCLDQLHLSSNMMEFLSFPSQEEISGHFIVLTRRNPKRLVNDVSVFEEDICLQLKCLQSEEAKQFLFSRTKVTRDQNENAESVAECLCEELGRLPLALEQAGAYIQMLRCSLSSYLEQYRAERLRLLSQQQARPVSPGNESSHRLAVHTTWHINIEYIKESPLHGQVAVRFMNACSFFDENEIQEELINVGKPEMEDVAYYKCVLSPLGCHQVLKLLTDFSLFTYVEAGCVRTHRLVQELVWENLDPKSKAESFIDAVRMLSYAFSKCPSPSNHVSFDDEEDISFSGLPNSPSHFYMWFKFCIHGHYLRRKIEDLLSILDSFCRDSVWFPETAKILYECAVHLSANRQQEEAKRTLNFAYRILDWLPLAEYETVEKNVSDNFLFPLPIPLPELFQKMIPRFWIPPSISLEPLAEKPPADASDLAPVASVLVPEATDFAPDANDLASDANDLAPDAGDLAAEATDPVSEAGDLAPEAGDPAPEASDLDLDNKIDKLELDANKTFQKGLFEEALDAYSNIIKLAKNCNKPFDPLLLTKRSMVYIQLEQWQNALKDANDYITRRPYCWRGYALKAVALDGLNKEASPDLKDNASAEIAAALAFYHNRAIFTDFPIFVESFPDLQNRIFICDGVDKLLDALYSHEVEMDVLKILVLGSAEYILNSSVVDKPWNNCILVGTRTNCSVSLKSDYSISLLQCMLTNLSFTFSESQLYCICLPDSLVKILNCNFTYDRGYGDTDGTIRTEGMFNAEQCNFTKCQLLCAEQSRTVVLDCSFCNNLKDGLKVLKGATLKVENSRIYNNGDCGLSVQGGECVVVNCDIHDNGEDGISCEESDNSTLMRNNIYNNNVCGIFALNSRVHVRENSLYYNFWGISVDPSACNISMNNIFGNKMGGVFLDEMFSSKPVYEMNKVFHNDGPGFLMDEWGDIRKSLKSADFQLNNEIHDNKEDENDSKLNLSVPYCSCCRKKSKLTMCEKCFTTAYCSEPCQKHHYSKHKKICKVLRQKSSYLITPTKEADVYEREVKGPEEVGPKLASPPRDDMRFVVKVHDSFGCLSKYMYTNALYDRNRQITVLFSSENISKLVEEFGVLCRSQCEEKKLFFHCLVEENGQLRLFTNEFAEFQNW